jgi:Holliday junction resolvasome RuvABC endonuclease subunit
MKSTAKEPKPLRDPLVHVLGADITRKMKYGASKVTEYRVHIAAPNRLKEAIGIDPGAAMGVCWIPPKYRSMVVVWLVEMASKKDLGHIGRLIAIMNLFGEGGDIGVLLPVMIPVIVEGAAYSKAPGQVALAEHRAAAILGVAELADDIRVVPPATVRAAVMGNGRINPKQLWEDFLPGDCADAVALAAYASAERE